MTAVTISVVDVNDKPQAGAVRGETKQMGWLTQCDFNSTFWTAAIVVPVAGNATGNATASADISFARSSFCPSSFWQSGTAFIVTSGDLVATRGCIFCNSSHLRLRYLMVKSSQLFANQCSTIPWTNFQVSDLRGEKNSFSRHFAAAFNGGNFVVLFVCASVGSHRAFLSSCSLT